MVQYMLGFMRTSFLTAVLLAVILAQLGRTSRCNAQESAPFYELKRKCISAINQRTAAFAARDWGTLEKRAKSYVSQCKGAFDDRDLSEAQQQIAYAQIELNRPVDGLAAASSCIETYYANSACHIRKVVALQKLGRLEEAKRSIMIALRLIEHNIDVTKLNLTRPLEALERELLESRLKEFEAQLGEAQAFQRYVEHE